jgi:hypothetical protein
LREISVGQNETLHNCQQLLIHYKQSVTESNICSKSIFNLLDYSPIFYKMSTFPPSPARQTAHSALYKMPSPTVRCDETWKDRYRLHCKQQFKRARDKVVNKMRQLSVSIIFFPY